MRLEWLQQIYCSMAMTVVVVRLQLDVEFNPVDAAQAADEVASERAQLAEALQHQPGMGAEDVPMHVEQPGPRRVEEQVDGFGLANATISCEGQGVGPIETDLIAAADQGFEPGDDARAPGTGLLDLCHPAFKKPLVDEVHRQLPFHAPRKLACRMLDPQGSSQGAD